MTKQGKPGVEFNRADQAELESSQGDLRRIGVDQMQMGDVGSTGQQRRCAAARSDHRHSRRLAQSANHAQIEQRILADLGECQR